MIKNPLGKKVIFDADLSILLGLVKENKNLIKSRHRHRLITGDTIINSLVSFKNLIINCDLVDRNENFFNEKPSNVLACFDIEGIPFERVVYSSKHSTFRKILGGKKIIDSLRITVKEETGEVIDFNELPLRFEIEII